MIEAVAMEERTKGVQPKIMQLNNAKNVQNNQRKQFKKSRNTQQLKNAESV